MGKAVWTVVAGLVACGGGDPVPAVMPDAAAPPDGASLQCGPGTHEDNDVCVLETLPRYEIRTTPTITANGYQTIDVTVIGTKADGTPSHENVVFSVDRASAGAFISPRAVLGDRGGATTFVPCNSTTAGCTGPARLAVALASAPAVEVAHVDVTLVAPAPVGAVVPCTSGGNVLHLDAQSFGFTGVQTVSTGFTFDVFGAANRARVQVDNGMQSYALELNTQRLDVPMLRSVFGDARMIGYAGAYQPVLDVGYRPCAEDGVGTFQIHSFTYDPVAADVTQITASFALHCAVPPPQTPTMKITGCVHYSQ